ncbi:AAA family ATPase [Endozoicomonas sp. GU-1]|uniref:AAA family ATPase n=1 Tax=Endozoicomonas sp. GU-1 TaxID=3009078 RepID=UPI0022B4B1C9|nr:AAA family ATPase [Endozoicomonas sp. GU-1]WBA81855.1 AAA family ATPase [Endozoicomonas sp. GU-1]WBA84809.1 AAA family ATPase [Endozoicomonas sp. GU-1]
MALPTNITKAVYLDPGVAQYRGNPLIEALPPILTTQDIRKGLIGDVTYDPREAFVDGSKRVHIIARLLDDFFQPLANHIQLETKLSIMIRRGYVGRNLADGSLNAHMQNGYERLMKGELGVFRFEQAKSTARSLALIGCSGSGKSTTLNRILATYPQAIYHEVYNFTQITYLKVDCPHDGSLKNLCIHFFRAIDNLIHTDYEQKYALKRHSIDTLLALMSQIANLHAIGVLVIDEIQHLSRQRSGGVEQMLNFFVTLVNVIGLPVVMVGTPKARPIFETDLRSGRRGAGFGALIWHPVKQQPSTQNPKTGQIQKSEWTAFTDKLWKYQWLQKRDELLSDDIRDCWYELSQGVLDIVVKLFVLAQLRAIATRTERLTSKLMRQVYTDEFKPVHPMLDALRSGDEERIAKYSDLTFPEIDEKLLELSAKIEESIASDQEELEQYGGNEQAERLHNLLIAMDCKSDLLVPLIKKAFKQKPGLSVRELIPVVLDWYDRPGKKPDGNSTKTKNKSISRKDWHTLETSDLRFKFTQVDDDASLYDGLKQSGMIFNTEAWLKEAG